MNPGSPNMKKECCPILVSFIVFISVNFRAYGSIVGKALCHKLEGHGFETQ
jgi:hypothetical protein